MNHDLILERDTHKYTSQVEVGKGKRKLFFKTVKVRICISYRTVQYEIYFPSFDIFVSL